MASLKIEPEIIIMQLERQYEALEEAVQLLEADVRETPNDHEHEEYAWDDHGHDDYAEQTDLEAASKLITELAEANAALERRVTELENLVASLMDRH